MWTVVLSLKKKWTGGLSLTRLRNAANTSNLSLPSGTRVCDSGNLLFTWSGSTSSGTIRAFKHPVGSTRQLVFLASKAIRAPSGISLGQGIFVPEGHGITTSAGVDAITCVLCGYDSIGWGLLPVTNGTPATTLTRLSAVSNTFTQNTTDLQITKAGSSGYMVVGSNENWFACDALGADVPQAFRNRMLNFPGTRIAHTGTRLYGNQKLTRLGSRFTSRIWTGITAYNNGLVVINDGGRYGTVSGNSFTELGDLSGSTRDGPWTGITAYNNGLVALERDSGRYGTANGDTFTELGDLSGNLWQGITAYNNGLVVINDGGRYGTVSGDTFTQLGDLSGIGRFSWEDITAYNNGLVATHDDGSYGIVSGNTFTQLGTLSFSANGITAYNDGLAIVNYESRRDISSYYSLQPSSYVSWPLSFGR